ncbi:MAG: RNA-directed DNA polymerase [Verrucomicrobia bacterium]|nr:RNA-directed DNA polymerase [Cytophagales bacterium]
MSILPENTQPRTRQELYDLIRQTSRDEFVLNEMIRLGFWKKNEGQPSLPEQLIRQETQLHQELKTLVSEKKRLDDQQKMLKEMRKKRMLESRLKREETKKRRELERQQKAENWKNKKTTEIGYLGENVSSGLNFTASNPEKLSRYNIPFFTNAVSLAQALNISVGELRFLAFSREVSKVNHYHRFQIPKKTGGQRLISAPMPRLKKVQTWILENVLEKIELHTSAHGFVASRSIVSNAIPHLKAETVVNLDLKNFFPTLTYARIKGLFLGLGYSEAMATLLGLLCTEPETDAVILDKETWFVASGERFLPQGSPASPALTNIICATLDKRLQGLAQKLGFVYTRYADDLTFSATGEGTKNIHKIISLTQKIVEDEGFSVHPDKTRIMRKGSKKEVTGIVVNEKPSVDRTTLRKFRALLHQMEKEGFAGKSWGHTPDVLAAVEGYANFVKMVDAEKGDKFKQQIKGIIAKWGDSIPTPVRKVYPKKEKQTVSPVFETMTILPTSETQISENQVVIPQVTIPETANKDTSNEKPEEKKTFWKTWKK